MSTRQHRFGLTGRKSIEASIQDTFEPEHQLKRELTTRDLIVFGVAVVVGAGIFTVTARTAGNIAGPAVSLAFVIAAIACGLAALCYAEFASTVPVAGSAYTFSYATFGEIFAWIIGWDLFLEFAVAAAVVAKGWGHYLVAFFGADDANTVAIGDLKIDWAACVIIGVLTILLAAGTKISSRVSTVITAIKVAVVLLVIIVGAFYIKASNYSPYIPTPEAGGTESANSGIKQSLLSWTVGAPDSHFGWWGVLAAASLVFFAFIGFDIVATTAEEAKDPQKSLPRGIIGSLLIVTVLYVAVTLVLTGMVHYTELATKDGHSATLATAFEARGITWAEVIINIGALAGLTTVVMVLLLGQIRVTFAMSRDGLLPRGLAKTGTRGTPVRITFISGIVVESLAYAVIGRKMLDKDAVAAVLEYAKDAVKGPVLEPAGEDDVTIKWTSEERETAARVYAEASRKAAEALRLERAGDMDGAISVWHSLFGDAFPDAPARPVLDVMTAFAAGSVSSAGRPSTTTVAQQAAAPGRSWTRGPDRGEGSVIGRPGAWPSR